MVPIFGDDIHIPTTALDGRSETLRINRKWERMTKRRRELTEETDAINHSLDTNENRYVPNVREKSLRSLVRGVVRLWILHVIIRQAVHELRVKVRIRVAHREHNLLRRQSALLHKLSLDASNRPRTVRTFPDRLACAEHVLGVIQSQERRPELVD